MPAEWAPHARMWMAWPKAGNVLAGDPGAAEEAWASVANAIARFQPVTMLVPPDEEGTARTFLDANVSLLQAEYGDCWLRDSGPTFVVDGQGALGAVDWTFNGWGGRTFPKAKADALVARAVAEAAGAVRFASALVNEGGGIHCDGEGTLLVTESVQLNANRNPNWSKADVEAELHRLLGTTHAIWLPRGLEADLGPLGTDGHIDTLACFVKPGVVVVHDQPDPRHPDHAASREFIAILEASTDAKGRPIEVIRLTAPAEKYDHEGAPLSCTYVNFVFANGAVVLCGFDDPRDAETAEIFARLWPERQIVQVPATRIFAGGGGIHCITQQEPDA